MLQEMAKAVREHGAGPGARLRRRRRPLRGGDDNRRGDLRRQDRPDAGPRPLAPAQGRHLRGRREVHRLYATDSRSWRQRRQDVYWKTGPLATVKAAKTAPAWARSPVSKKRRPPSFLSRSPGARLSTAAWTGGGPPSWAMDGPQYQTRNFSQLKDALAHRLHSLTHRGHWRRERGSERGGGDEGVGCAELRRPWPWPAGPPGAEDRRGHHRQRVARRPRSERSWVLVRRLSNKPRSWWW